MTDRHEPARSRTVHTDLVEALLASLGGDPTALTKLDPDERAAAEDLQPWLALLVEHGPSETGRDELLATAPPDLPDLADDPIAVALGLVADPEQPLSAESLTRTRRSRGLRPSAIKAALKARGWDVSTAELALWERVDTPQPPALLKALAETLGVDTELLAPVREIADPDWLADMLSDERIEIAIQQWADEQRLPVRRIRQRLSRALVGAGYRKQQTPTVESLLAVIAVLRELEQPGRGR